MKMETRHYEWLYSAAHDHFVEKINENEKEIAQHKSRIEDGHHTYFRKGLSEEKKTRIEKIADLERWIEQYSAIAEFCAATRRELLEVGSQESAEGIAEFLRRKHPQLKKPKGSKAAILEQRGFPPKAKDSKPAAYGGFGKKARKRK